MHRRTDFLGREIIPEKTTIVVALSGGADSVALLHMLHTAGYKVIAAHLNHMLRGDESDRDEDFCCEICAKIGVWLIVERADVNKLKKRGEGIEAAARRVRYDFLERVAIANHCTCVATAHNANDNAETVLMNLARGTGLNGLAGIAPTLQRGDITIIRPILHLTRTEIELYLQQNNLNHVTDSTNTDTAYTRNFVRHEIIPLVERVNPRFVEHTTALSGDVRSASGDAKTWRAEYLALTHNTLSRAHVEAIRKLKLGDNASGVVSLPGGVIARREYDKIVIQYAESVTIPDEKPLKLGENTFADSKIMLVRAVFSSTIGNIAAVRAEFLPSLTVRSRKSGDSISPYGRGYTKTLQKLFIDLKIPQNKRDMIPIVCINSQPAAVPDLPAHCDFAACENEDAILIIFK